MKKFHPAFDMPNTPAEALAVLQAWGDPLTMTFNPKRSARCAELLQCAVAPSTIGIPGPVLAALHELERATKKFPTWPSDPLHAIAVIGEEFGELTQAVLQETYEPEKAKSGAVYSEAVQTAAMVIRFLSSIDRYQFAKGDQHSQGAAA